MICDIACMNVYLFVKAFYLRVIVQREKVATSVEGSNLVNIRAIKGK